MSPTFQQMSNRHRRRSQPVRRLSYRSRKPVWPASKRLVARVLAVMALSVVTGSPLYAQSAAGDAAKGKAVYARAGCANCHGASGVGGGAAALVPMSHPLTEFIKLVRQPSSTVMPALTPALASDADVADLHAFLRSLSPSGQAAAVVAPAGNVENGKKLFAAAACYACHGYVGQGGSAGPRLGPPAVSYAAFQRALRHPREEMPPYTPKSLSDQQVADIYSYVKTFPEPPDVNTIPILKPPPQKH